MNDDELLRYSRQILLPEIGIEGQQRLADGRALVIGLGGLGSPVAMYLAAAGVGTLEIVDDDTVDTSNLQRQILHTTQTVGSAKTASAALALGALNPNTRVHTQSARLHGRALRAAVEAADLVLDCSDNFATRFAVNAACRAARTALVSGAAIRWQGQVCVFDGQRGSPCYRCLFPEDGEEETRCSETGIVAPLVGIIGAVQALEAVKLLCGTGNSLAGRLLQLDALHMRWRETRLRRDPVCPVCSQD